LFFAGLVVVIFLFSLIEIVGNKVMLSNAESLGLSIEEVWAYEGALKWWNNFFASLVVTVSTVLMLSGVAFIFRLRLVSFGQNLISNKFHFNLNKPTQRIEVKHSSFVRDEANEILKNLAIKESLLKKQEERLMALREKWEDEIEQNIRVKEQKIQQLRIEINDLKYIEEELNNQSRLPQFVNQ
jgi:hypothetical protein